MFNALNIVKNKNIKSNISKTTSKISICITVPIIVKGNVHNFHENNITTMGEMWLVNILVRLTRIVVPFCSGGSWITWHAARR